MPPENDTDNPSPEPVAAPPPSPTFVPTDDFKRYVEQSSAVQSEMLEALKVLRSAIVDRPSGGASPSVPLEPRISDEQFDEAVRNGDSRVIRAYQHQQIADLRRTEIDPMRASGQAALAELAKKTSLADKPLATRFKKEIDAQLEALAPELRVNPIVYDRIYQMVVGAHADELVAEAKEAALRSASEPKPEPVPAPGTRGGRGGTAGAEPTIEEILGDDAVDTLRSMGKNPDEFARRLGYKDMADYLKVAQKQMEEMGGGR